MSDSIVKLWKEHNVESVVMNFACGGDSMNDTDWEISPDTVPDNVKKELEDHFDNVVYNNVEFYVNSDGHYEGEAGTVTITLEDDDTFYYAKNAESEYREMVTNVVDFGLSSEEETFVKNNVLNINGGEGTLAFNYKRDFIMSDEDEELQKELEDRIHDFVRHYIPDNIEEGGDPESESNSFTTNEAGEVLTITEGKLKLKIDTRYIIFKPSAE